MTEGCCQSRAVVSVLMADDHSDHPYAALHLSEDMEDIEEIALETNSCSSSPLKGFKDSPRKVLVHENTNVPVGMVNMLPQKVLDEHCLTCLAESEQESSDGGKEDKSESDAVNSAGESDMNPAVASTDMDKVDNCDEIDGVTKEDMNDVSKDSGKALTSDVELVSVSEQDKINLSNGVTEQMKEDKDLPEKKIEQEDMTVEAYKDNTAIEKQNDSNIDKLDTTEKAKKDDESAKGGGNEQANDIDGNEEVENDTAANESEQELETSTNAYEDETDEGDESLLNETANSSGNSEGTLTATNKGPLVLSIGRKRGRKRKRRRSLLRGRPTPVKVAKYSEHLDSIAMDVTIIKNASKLANLENEEATALTDDNSIGTSTADLETDDLKGKIWSLLKVQEIS